MNIDSLNDRQREAVLYNDGPLLIIAGAGAGKAHTIFGNDDKLNRNR